MLSQNDLTSSYEIIRLIRRFLTFGDIINESRIPQKRKIRDHLQGMAW